ncbi:uncharacterized protein LOC129904253 [Solanum dulcamara]|uniref:uncharacterized protein LOC129904253 n=1 Tax=Solanum dulcamara TaxID=45834 RepID=UPI002484F9C7|nr:uncharacterized protein LOC129904253 [Solanum dulcamara]
MIILLIPSTILAAPQINYYNDDLELRTLCMLLLYDLEFWFPYVAAAPVPPSPPSPVQSQPAAGGLGSSFTDGMAFGSGNAVGHTVTDAVLGVRDFKHEVKVADPAPSAGSTAVGCGAPMAAFQECLNNGGDLSKCQFYMNMVCECRRSSTTVA